MTQVLIDRELLEHMRNFTVMHDSGVAGVLRGQIDAILANPAQQGEVVEVVGIRISTDGFGSYIADSAMGIGAVMPGEVREPLMTVAQHKRILAASVPAGCKVVPVELLERLEHVTRTLVPHLQCHVDLRALLASAEGVKDE